MSSLTTNPFTLSSMLDERFRIFLMIASVVANVLEEKQVQYVRFDKEVVLTSEHTLPSALRGAGMLTIFILATPYAHQAASKHKMTQWALTLALYALMAAIVATSQLRANQSTRLYESLFVSFSLWVAVTFVLTLSVSTRLRNRLIYSGVAYSCTCVIKALFEVCDPGRSFQPMAGCISCDIVLLILTCLPVALILANALYCLCVETVKEETISTRNVAFATHVTTICASTLVILSIFNWGRVYLHNPSFLPVYYDRACQSTTCRQFDLMEGRRNTVLSYSPGTTSLLVLYQMTTSYFTRASWSPTLSTITCVLVLCIPIYYFTTIGVVALVNHLPYAFNGVEEDAIVLLTDISLVLYATGIILIFLIKRRQYASFGVLLCQIAIALQLIESMIIMGPSTYFSYFTMFNNTIAVSLMFLLLIRVFCISFTTASAVFQWYDQLIILTNRAIAMLLSLGFISLFALLDGIRIEQMLRYQTARTPRSSESFTFTSAQLTILYHRDAVRLLMLHFAQVPAVIVIETLIIRQPQNRQPLTRRQWWMQYAVVTITCATLVGIYLLIVSQLNNIPAQYPIRDVPLAVVAGINIALVPFIMAV